MPRTPPWSLGLTAALALAVAPASTSAGLLGQEQPGAGAAAAPTAADIRDRYGAVVSGDPAEVTPGNLAAFDAEMRTLTAHDPALADLVRVVRFERPAYEGDMGAYDPDTRTMTLVNQAPGGVYVRGTATHEVGHALHYSDPAWHQRLRDSLVNVPRVYPDPYAEENQYESTAEIVRAAVGVDGTGNDRPDFALPRASWDILGEKVPLRADWEQRILPESIVAAGPRMPPLSEEPLGPVASPGARPEPAPAPAESGLPMGDVY